MRLPDEPPVSFGLMWLFRLLVRWGRWFIYGLFTWLPGYGHRSWAPFVVGVSVLVVGWWIFAQAHDDGFMMKSPDAAHQIKVKPVAAISDLLRQWEDELPTIVASALADGRRQCGAELPAGEARPVPCTPEQTQNLGEGGRKPAASPGSSTSGTGDPAFPAEGKIEEYASFNAFMYSLDLLLPVVEFSQSNYWIPGEDESKIKEKGWTESQRRYGLASTWLWYWLQIALGWYLTTVIVTNLTGLFERKE